MIRGCICWRGGWILLLLLVLATAGVCSVVPEFMQLPGATKATNHKVPSQSTGEMNHSCSTGICHVSSVPHDLLTKPASLLLTNILQIAKWKYVIIIFDEDHVEEVPDLVTHLSNSGTTFMLFQYSIMIAQPGGLDALILTGNDSWLQQLHILLLCSSSHSIHLLQHAEEFQARLKMRSALSFTSQWLVLEDPDEEEKLNLGNLTMINVAKLRCHRGSSCCKHSSLTYNGCGMVTTLLWRGEKNWVRHLGTVRDVVCFQSDVFPGRQWGFNRRMFSVSTLPWIGFVEVSRTKNESLHYYGLCVDLLKELAFQLNFTYRLSEPEDGIWGIRYDNGTWAGLVGQLAYSDVDLVVAPITVTQQREQVMDFSYPYFNDADTVVYKKPDPKKHKWMTYLQPLKWQVLVCIGISLVIASLMLGFIESWTPFYPGNRLSTHRGHHSPYFRAFRLVYGALLAQADEHLPRSHSGRMFVSCWWLFSIVVAATYSGNLIAFLTVDKSKPLFDTLQDLLDQDTYRWGFMGGSAIHHTVKASNFNMYSTMWSSVQKWMSEDANYLTTNISVHYQRLLEGEYAFVSDRATFERWTADRCDLELAKETFLPTEYGVGLPNDSAFTRIFSREILLMHENGLLEKLREKWWPDKPICEPYTTTRATAVTAVDMQSAFYLLLIGAFTALLALSVEYIAILPVWTAVRKCLIQQKNA